MLFPPEARILTAPTGGGKTEAALEAILQVRQFKSFAPVWVLLASGQQAQDFQARLLARSPDAVQFGVEYFTVDTLYTRVLMLLGHSERRVSDAARLGILRRVIADLNAAGELVHYGPIAAMPGFVGLVAGLIHELKQGLAEPEQFTQAAEQRGPKDRDLARIYTAYQDMLQDPHYRLVDRHGAGWLAVRQLEQGVILPDGARPELLIVDGFDQFSAVSRRVIVALARQLPQTLVTLTAVPAAPGRRFRRFEQTLDRLLEGGRSLDRLLEGGQNTGAQVWQVAALPAPGPASVRTRPPVLAHLVDQVFRSAPDPISGDESLRLIEAPNPLGEVAAALRYVKRLLLDGALPDSVAVVARDLTSYAGALSETARTYGLPLVVRASLPLLDNPAVAALVDLIDLAAQDFPRRDLIDLLHSPYLVPPDLTPDQIAQLERISRLAQVVRGRAQWLEAVAAAGLPGLDEEGEADSLIPTDEAGVLVEALARHMDRLTPPPQATVEQYVAWIADRILPDPADLDNGPVNLDSGSASEDAEADRPHPKSLPTEWRGTSEASSAPSNANGVPDMFNVLACIRSATDPERVTRDVRALGALRGVLVGLRAAHDLLAADGSAPVMDWADFRAELEPALKDAAVLPEGGLNRLGRVLAASAAEARGLPHDHVIVLGLSEGIFPQNETDDALYSETDRRELERGTPRIEMLTPTERSDDMSLFYQVIGLARRSLTLTRFTVDDKGTEVPPSPYWGAVRAVVDVPPAQVTRLVVGAAPALEDAAAPGEVAVALAAALSGERMSQVPGAASSAPTHEEQIALLYGVHAALSSHESPSAQVPTAQSTLAAAWQNARRGRALEAGREDPARAPDRWLGVLGDPALIEAAERLLGSQRVWSASQFDEYGACPYRFFARRMLRLEELTEPEEGPDVLQTGSLNHKILEETYTRIAAEELTITPEHAARALDILDEVAGPLLAEAPQRFGFRASPVWEYERGALLQRLRWLVAQDFGPEHPFRARTGKDAGSHPLAARVGDRVRVPYWQEATFGFGDQPPLELEGPAGVIRVRGKIDRMDLAGDCVVLIDYKTGSRPHRVEDMAAGREFQMVVYLLAADSLLRDAPVTVAGGLFWHIRRRTTSGEICVGDEAVTLARKWMHAHVLRARTGYFAVRPAQPNQGVCGNYCEFRALCRYARVYSRKQEQDQER